MCLQYLPACMYVQHAHAFACGCQRKRPDLWELELETAVSHIWVLGTDPSPLRRAGALNHQVTSSAPVDQNFLRCYYMVKTTL